MRKITLSYLWAALLMHNSIISKNISDELYLKMVYRGYIGKKLNLSNPITFNEKIQWLKLHDHNPVYTTMVDKYEAKKYVANIIGEEYIIPTLGVWEHFDDIDFETLPNQFVLKCTHDSGGLVICNDINKFNKKMAKRKIEKCLRNDYFLKGREWPYKNIVPKIIAEKYIEDNSNLRKGLTDYKIHIFNGCPKFILVCTDRYSRKGLSEAFYTCDWKKMKVCRPFHSFNELNVEKPECLENMLELSKKLSENIRFCRVDFYICNNKILFGELTLYPSSGLNSFVPDSFDIKSGNWLVL